MIHFSHFQHSYKNILYQQLQEGKISAIQEKLELSDQKLAQLSKLPDLEEQLKARLEAFNQVGAKVGYNLSITFNKPI